MSGDLQLNILQQLEKAANGVIADTRVAFPEVSFQTMQAAVTSLMAKNMVRCETLEKDLWTLTDEGVDIVQNGSHEWRLFNEVCNRTAGLKLSEVSTVMGESGKVGQQRAFKNKWLKKDGDALVQAVDSIDKDQTKEDLQQIQSTGKLDNNEKELADLKKRKLVTKQRLKSYQLSKGDEFALEIKQYATDLTLEMLQDGSWKTAQFKDYNFNAGGAVIHSGALHPLSKVREEFRQIFFSMGFTEMPTDQYVDSGFWNFDTLFVPQQHPARDLQDTFYLKDPVEAKLPEKPQLIANVKSVHQDGKFGSIGYRYPWSEQESKKLVLRTHTTAISAAMLNKLAESPGPARYFSIDKVFRNEAVDATHLAEFQQIEGVIADYGLTLGDLIGFMQKFFHRMGVHNLRFKPAYNPYTEPSMEIFSWHEGLGKWVEIGNSGMFRPEMLETLGLPKDLRVHGWGLSLERPTMIKYAVSNIRDLVGHKVSLDFVENNPAVRLDEDLV